MGIADTNDDEYKNEKRIKGVIPGTHSGTQTLQEYLEENKRKPVPQQQGNRDNRGKVPLSYLFDFPNALRELCRVSEYGGEHRPLSAELQKQLGREKGYGKQNWKKGLPLTKTLDSQMRHLISFFGEGEVFDAEAFEAGHEIYILAQVAWNALVELEMFLTNEAMDDRVEGLKRERTD